MAKPNIRTLIKVYGDNIMVWTDEPEKEVENILALDGVDWAHIIIQANPIFVSVDPRYNANEVAAEIRELLRAEVPEIFKE